jgi:predicted metal-dependent HD superfamily phosphohydrolase
LIRGFDGIPIARKTPPGSAMRARRRTIAMTAQQLLSETWWDLARRYGLNAAAAQSVLDELIAAYRAPARHYHTIEHIAALLRQIKQHGDGLLDRDAVALAILFHDVVYEPRRQDNEAVSAALAGARLTALAFPAPLVAKVVGYIEATAHGLKPANTDADLALLLDFDLATLAAPAHEYRAYATAIRKEYQHVPDTLYRLARRHILQGFLDRERIYLTAHLYTLWEERARANISDEIAGLAEAADLSDHP